MQGDHNRFDHQNKNLLKLLSCQIREILESLDCNAALPTFTSQDPPAEHTTKSLTSQWISESSINECAAVVVHERMALGDA